jgi:hypothetical protein
MTKAALEADLRALEAEDEALQALLARRRVLPAWDRWKVAPGRVPEGEIAAHMGALHRQRRRLEMDIRSATP